MPDNESERAAADERQATAVPDEALEQARRVAEMRRNALQSVLDEGYSVVGTEETGDAFVLHLVGHDRAERRATVGGDGKMRFNE